MATCPHVKEFLGGHTLGALLCTWDGTGGTCCCLETFSQIVRFKSANKLYCDLNMLTHCTVIYIC